MGYGITTTAFYGFHLDDEKSTRLVDSLGDFVQENPDHPISQACQQLKYAPGDLYFDLFEMFDVLGELVGTQINMVAEDSDSRIHNCTYEPGFDHGFGVVLAASGYGGNESSKELSAIMQRGPSEQGKQAYINAVSLWVKFAGISEEPCVVMVSNTD